MAESFGALAGAILRAKLGEPKTSERDRTTLMTLAGMMPEPGASVVCGLSELCSKCRATDNRTVKESLKRLAMMGLIESDGLGVRLVEDVITTAGKRPDIDPRWSARFGTGVGIGSVIEHEVVMVTSGGGNDYQSSQSGELVMITSGGGNGYQRRSEPLPAEVVMITSPLYVSLSDPQLDPLADPPHPPTPHGQDEEEEAKGQEVELLAFAGDDIPLPTDDDLALWGELVEAHTVAVDFFAESEPATVARPAAPSKPAQIEDPFVTAAREAPIKESTPAARELRAELERILAPSIGRQQRGGIALDPLTALSLQSIVTGLMGKGATEEDALHAILDRLDEAGTKTSPLGWLRTVLLSPPRTAQEARNGGDRYPRQGGGGYGAQDAPKPSMKPLTDADLSPLARWFQAHYGCLMDLRTYPLDFPFMSDSDRAVLEQFHADLKSGKIREEDIP